MALLLLLLCSLIGLWIVGGLCARPINAWLKRYWPALGYEGEPFLLWGGLLLSVFALGLLVMYVILAQ